MDAELRGMVMSYRVTELQALLAFAGKNKQGRKNELQARALDLVRAKTPQVVLKMRELYRTLQLSHYGQPLSLSSNSSSAGSGATASSMVSSSRYDNSGYYAGGYKQGQESTFGRSTLQSIGYQRVVSMDGQYRSVPICPDVKLKELPFYDIQSVLIRPSSLLNNSSMPKQETQHSFCLTPNQAAEIAHSKEIVPSDGVQNSRMQFNVQVQVRFCALDTEEEQDDCFPQSLIVKVNGRNIQLPHPIPSNRPGVEAKRPSKPLNVTNSVKCSPIVTNTVSVQWVADSTRNFAISVNIVKRLTAEELFLRLKSKRIQPADYTRGRIKEITSAEEEDLCAPTSIRVSVACPLGKNRMTYPCRATTCKHLQCFDANLFLLMNEKKPTFICPVCNKHLKFGDLSIDGYFMDVIKELSIDNGNDIELYPDGRWEPAVKVKKELEDVGPPPKKRMKGEDGSSGTVPSLNDTIDLDDDILVVEDVTPTGGQTSSSANRNSGKSAEEPEVIDLIDSSDDEETETETTRMSFISGGSGTVTPTMGKEMEEFPPTTQERSNETDDSDDEDTIGRRPRRRAKKVNYIEESSSDTSTNDGTTTVVQTNTNPRRPRSPACIELSDSAPSSPEASRERQPRAFAAVSSHSSRSSSASSHPNRSGSGSSTLYSSSATTTTMPTPTGIGLPSPMDSLSTPHLLNPSSSTFSYSSTSSQSASLFSNPPVPTTLPPSSSLYFSSTSTTVPGYTAYDARSGWEADLNSFINVQQQLGYGQMNLASYDYMNPSTHQNPSNYSGFGARPPRGTGPGGGYPGWL